MKIKLLIIGVCIVFLLGFIVYQYISLYDGKLHVVFCDVGQGDGIYIRTPKGTDIIVDSGRDESILKCLNSNMPFWDRTIELAFATHPDADHIAGFVPILEGYKVKSYNTVKLERDTGVFLKIQKLLEKQGISPRYLYAGDTYKLADGIRITTYWPSPEFIDIGDVDSNRYSLVQILKYKDFDLLINGDIDFDILNQVLKSTRDDANLEIFKLSHHGSRTGLDLETLTLIKPMLTIISAGKNNSYGHPHKEVINEMKKYNLRFLETKNGNIRIKSNGKKFWIF